MPATVMFTGYVCSPPQVKTAKNGTVYVKFRLALSDRHRNEAGEWVTPANPVYMQVVAFDPLVANVTDVVAEQRRVSGTAKLRQYRWNDDEGAPRVTTELVLTGPISPAKRTHHQATPEFVPAASGQTPDGAARTVGDAPEQVSGQAQIASQALPAVPVADSEAAETVDAPIWGAASQVAEEVARQDADQADQDATPLDEPTGREDTPELVGAVAKPAGDRWQANGPAPS